MTANWNLGQHVEGSSLPGPVSSFAVEERSGRKYVPVMVEGLAPADWDAVALSYDVSGNLTGVVYSLSGETKRTLVLSYDGSGNLTDVSRS